MFSISFRDILTIPALKHLREIDLLDPVYDVLTYPFIHAMGIDTVYPVSITVNLHRDLNNKVGVGYRYTGMMRRDREFVNSGFCDIVSRVSIAMAKDKSLGDHLCELLGKTVDFEKAALETDIDQLEREPESMCDDADYVKNNLLIKTLEDVRDCVRGNNNNKGMN